MPAQRKLVTEITGGTLAQRVRADGRIAISDFTGGLADHHIIEYGQTGGSPSQRVRADGRIAISESTGGMLAQSKRVDGQNAGSEETGERVDRWLRE